MTAHIFAAGNGWLIPHDINEVWWASAAFFIVVGLIWWKGGPAIKAGWNGRIERIEGELASAEQARTEAEAELGRVRSQISDADSARERILADARATAENLERQLVERAHTEAAEAKARAEADLASARHQVLGDLSDEIGALALGAAEAVVASNLDETTQQGLIDAYINQVGSAR
ncbi:MAG: F0F1 ATP synthase subunit B [Acidimicrobiia bacterium]|nr:F0F1 ATP synthase subunit B [Acidimicrobiia bacterium]